MVDSEGNCSTCSDFFNAAIRLRKQKQLLAVFEADATLPKVGSYDRRLDNGACGNQRPDFYWDAGTHAVIVECDEHQHNSITRECDQTRMMNLTSEIGMPVFWVRYNPDVFRGQWPSLTERERHDTLKRTLRMAFQSPPTDPSETLRVVYLYYDDMKRGASLETERIPML